MIVTTLVISMKRIAVTKVKMLIRVEICRISVRNQLCTWRKEEEKERTEEKNYFKELEFFRSHTGKGKEGSHVEKILKLIG